MNVAFTHMTTILTYFIGNTSHKATVFIAIASVGLIGVMGCSRPSDARLNSVFTPTQAFGPTGNELVANEPGLNDVISSRVLSKEESQQVRDILESVVQGNFSPMKPALYGVRFEDAPRAMISAAKIVEMAILSTDHQWPRIEFDFLDESGEPLDLVVTLKRRTPVVRPSIISKDFRLRRAHAEVAAAMTRAIIGVELTDPAKIEILGHEVIAAQRGKILETRFIPEKYRFNLTMLDGQPAGLVVTREPEPQMVSWETNAGLFDDSEDRLLLDKAFSGQLRAWGAISSPTIQK